MPYAEHSMPISPLQRLIDSHRIAWFALLLLAAIGGGYLALVQHNATKVEGRMFQTLVGSASQRIESEFKRFFDPVVNNLDIIARWAGKGEFQIEQPSDLNQVFIPILQQFPQVSALILADRDGNEYFLLSKGDQWLTRITRSGEGMRPVQWIRWDSATNETDRWQEESNYHPRGRPWFKGAMLLDQPSERYWTAPYTFFTLQQPGITVATRTSTADGRTLVIGFDVLLSEIGQTTTTASVGEHGKVFVLTSDDKVLGPPRHPRFDNDPGALAKALLTPATALNIQELNIALETWKQRGEQLGEPFSFKVGRRPWWGVLRSFPLEGRGFRIGYIVPEKEFADQLGISGGVLKWTGVALALLALIAAGFSIVVLRRNPPAATVAMSEAADNDADRVQALIAAGEGEQIEFKSTLRWNINSDKPGREVEISWLKTVVAFLNTGGGDLLIGVDDEGKVLGTGRDRFPNEDKYLLHVNNLINQYIGLERTPYIRFCLVPVGEEKVLRVRCEPSKNAAFLTIGKEEEFYIRSGPGSRKLPPSKILRYLEDRLG